MVEVVLRREGLIVLGLAAVYLFVYGALAVLRHESYHSFGFDLGLFNQTFWNTTQGRPFESTMSQAQPIPHSLFGDHFSPILWALVPFYYAYPHPETLVVLQTVALALGAWPVYLLAKAKLPNGYPLLWVLAYFLFIPLAYINLDDFHEVTFAVAPLGFALYFVERGRTGPFLLSLLLVFLVKEEMALIGAAFGAYVLLSRRDWKVGLGVLAGSLLAFAAVIQVVIPFFANGHPYPYIGERYAEVGGSLRGMVTTLVTDPLRIARSLLQPKKIYFVVALFGSTLGISVLAGWASVVLLPTLAYLLLSNYDPQFSFTSQYSAPLIPLIIGTAILAMARMRQSWLRPVMTAVLASSLAFSWAFGDMPFSRKFDPSLYTTQSRYSTFVRYLAVIPRDASVSAETGFSSHLSERRYIYDYYFEGTQNADWVVLDYEGANYDLASFDTQVASVGASGYDEVASGLGLALFHKRG